MCVLCVRGRTRCLYTQPVSTPSWSLLAPFLFIFPAWLLGPRLAFTLILTSCIGIVVTCAFFLACLWGRQEWSEVLMVMEGHIAMGPSWPWASWAGSRLCISLVVVSEGRWGFRVAKLGFPCMGVSVSSEYASGYPKCMAKWGVTISHCED